MTSRRGQGEGSVYQRADGTWVVAIDLGYGPDGKRRRVVRRAKTKKAAMAKLDALRTSATQHVPIPDQRTSVEQYLNWWLDEVVPGTIKDSTAAHYRMITNAYLIPHLGRRRLASLGPEHVQAMLRHMEREGLSPWTRRNARTVLSSALTRAVKFDLVTRNASALVDAPRLVQTSVDDALTVEDVRKLLKHLHDKDDRNVALAEVALQLGLRRGELLALKWDDIDLDARTLHVRGTLKDRKGGGWYIDEPKTKAGDRIVPLTEHMRTELTEHRRRQVAEQLSSEIWTDHGFVFASAVGTPLGGRNVVRWWHDALAAAKLSPRPFHATRRTAVSLMAEAGVPLEVASRIIGHASIRMTADVYMTVRPKAQLDALDALEKHLLGAP